MRFVIGVPFGCGVCQVVVAGLSGDLLTTLWARADPGNGAATPRSAGPLRGALGVLVRGLGDCLGACPSQTSLTCARYDDSAAIAGRAVVVSGESRVR